MTGTIPRIRPRPKAVAPPIREVCLVGSPRRTYVHVRPGEAGIRQAGSRNGREIGPG